ncbi:MAG: VOC family protein [Comamonadaceae bacterium]|nr:MAG: VOC family protein [Comamonadaceae bacterium]
MISQGQLRATFAFRLSEMYGREVPAYTTLVDVSREVNEHVLRGAGADAMQGDSIGRVTAERHGAIRVGTPRELEQVARIFAALGMHPVGFYDLRSAASSSVPVVSTAFRPIDEVELAHNPFRVFTSMLTSDDPRFFTPELRQRLENFLDRRQLFSPELLELAGRAERERELSQDDADRFLDLAVASFELSTEPIDKGWYDTLEKVSAVAADIGGVRTTHINHLTPRVLDIDELYRRMTERGIQMIDAIQGPPKWSGPGVLLRQTSFRALAEPRVLRNADGSLTEGDLRVRFGEVEARGIALTPAGRARYDELLAATDQVAHAHPDRAAAEVGRDIWEQGFPSTEQELITQELAYFTYHRSGQVTGQEGGATTISELLDQGAIVAKPITYEDFLPRSAAGIFQSNLNGEGTRDTLQQGTHYDAGWLAGALQREVHDPFDLYKEQQDASIARVLRDRQLAQL